MRNKGIGVSVHANSSIFTDMMLSSLLDMAAVLRRLAKGYTKHPLLCNVGLYGTLYALGDVSQQNISGKKKVDLKSAARVSTVGATLYGPFYYYWYRILEKKIPGTATRNIVKKVVIDQAIAGSGGVFTFFVGQIFFYIVTGFTRVSRKSTWAFHLLVLFTQQENVTLKMMRSSKMKK